jgi:hypothetical protein
MRWSGKAQTQRRSRRLELTRSCAGDAGALVIGVQQKRLVVEWRGLYEIAR